MRVATEIMITCIGGAGGGEEGGGSSKPAVERHVQTEIRATVAPAPYVEAARVAYRTN